MNNKEQIKWELDTSHSAIEFKIKHLMISHVTGIFKKFSGTAVTPGLDFSSVEVDIDVDVASLETGDKKRDEHLRSDEFFESDKFPKINFKAAGMQNVNSGVHYELIGDLTIKGITKKIKLNIEFGGVIKDPWGKEKSGFNITGIVNRKDYGLSWNTSLEAGGVMLGDDVRINCDVEFTKVENKEGEKVMQAKEDKEMAAE